MNIFNLSNGFNFQKLRKVGFAKFLIAFSFMLLSFNTALAADVNVEPVKPFLPIHTEAYIDDFVNVPDSSKKDAFGKTSIILSNATIIVQMLLGGIAALLAILSAVGMVTTGMDNEEGLTHLKNTMLYIVLGFGMVFLAGEIGQLLSLQQGGLIGAKAEVLKRVQIFDKNVDVILAMIKYLIAGVAILFITISGARMVAGGYSEEDASKEKSYIVYASIGLVLFLVIDNFLGNIIYSIDSPFVNPTISPSGARAELIGFTNLVVSFMGPIAILSTIIGGVMYAASGFDEEQAAKGKRMILVSLAGIVLIYSAFSIVSTVLAGQF